MMWRSKAFDWKQRYAVIPLNVGDRWYWLEWYWSRFSGDHYQIVIGKGRAALGQEGGGNG